MIAAAPRPGGAAMPAPPERPRAVLMHLLDDLAVVLRPLSSATYAAAPFPGLSGSVGQHVRHALDHVAGVCAAVPGVALSYDHRARGTTVETDVATALATIRRLKAALAVLPACEDQPMTVTAAIVRDGAPAAAATTLGRELLFVISHTIHHYALIGVLLSTLGVPVPAGFGLAPSTPVAHG